MLFLKLNLNKYLFISTTTPPWTMDPFTYSKILCDETSSTSIPIIPIKTYVTFYNNYIVVNGNATMNGATITYTNIFLNEFLYSLNQEYLWLFFVKELYLVIRVLCLYHKTNLIYREL